jgi:subtilisin-like proprotein convertase family protein
MQAAPVTYNGPGGLVPDNDPAGVNFDIVIADTGFLTSFDRISVSMFHSWAGDLTLSLTHLETGTSLIFLDRILSLAPGHTGDSSNLGKVLEPHEAAYAFVTDLSTFTFSPNSIWGAASMVSDSFYIPGGTYAASANARTGDALSSYVPTDLNIFAGENIAGTWRLNASDNSEVDLGSISSWRINATISETSTPEPASMALVISALPLIGLLRMRRC